MSEQPAWRLTDEELIQTAHGLMHVSMADIYRDIADAQARKLVKWLNGWIKNR